MLQLLKNLKFDITHNIVYDLKTKYRLLKRDPVFVYQMGKVGSKSIYSSLQRRGKNAVHVHTIGYDNYYYESRRLRAFARDPSRPVKIICAVRNPFERNESSFFSSFSRHVEASTDINSYSVEQLVDLYIKYFPHRYPLDWFDYELKVNFGIDIYDFELTRPGFVKAEVDNRSVLVIKAEMDDQDKSKLIRDFLEDDSFELIRENEAKNKDYAESYREFKKEINYPDKLKKEILNSKFYQFFYE